MIGEAQTQMEKTASLSNWIYSNGKLENTNVFKK